MKKLLLIIVSVIFISLTINAKTQSDTETFTGTIGPYKVIVTLSCYNYGHGLMGDMCDIKGNYNYLQNGTTLKLKGQYSTGTGYRLDEFTAKGRKSAEWNFQEDFDYPNRYVGKFKNLSNGQEYEIILKKTN